MKKRTFSTFLFAFAFLLALSVNLIVCFKNVEAFGFYTREKAADGGEISLPSVSFYDKGDVNCDDKIDVTDCVIICRYAKSGKLNNSQIADADMNGDKAVDMKDADILAEYIIGKRKTLD